MPRVLSGPFSFPRHPWPCRPRGGVDAPQRASCRIAEATGQSAWGYVRCSVSNGRWAQVRRSQFIGVRRVTWLRERRCSTPSRHTFLTRHERHWLDFAKRRLYSGAPGRSARRNHDTLHSKRSAASAVRRDDRGGLCNWIVRDQCASTCELPPHRVALLFEIDVAMTVVGAFAIHVVVDHAEQRFARQCLDGNVDDLPSGHVTATATMVLARCI